MTGRFVRSQTAELVAEVIGSRVGKNYLESHGWKPGTPIVMAQNHEPLEDIMGLVSVHETPVFVAMVRAVPKSLCFLHVVLGTKALEIVEVADSNETIGQFYERAKDQTFEVFRVRYWPYSAVAHALPEIAALAPTSLYSVDGVVPPEHQ